MKKRIFALALTLVILVGLFPSITSAAEQQFTINGVTVSASTGKSLYNCSDYASEILRVIWKGYNGKSIVTTTFNSNYNMLKGLSAEDRKITEEHVKAYIQAAPLGSRIRICNASDTTTNNYDNSRYGHTMVLVAKDNQAGNFTTLESGSGSANTRTYTYQSFSNTWTNYKKSGMSGGYSYFFYIADLSCFASDSDTQQAQHTSHYKGTYQWYDKTHPHYRYFTCGGCGELFTDGTTAENYTRQVIAPTCVDTGYTLSTCTVCGKQEKENTVSPLGHDYKLLTETPATYTQEGSRTYQCSRCGDSYNETIGKLTGLITWGIPDEIRFEYDGMTETLTVYPVQDGNDATLYLFAGKVADTLQNFTVRHIVIADGFTKLDRCNDFSDCRDIQLPATLETMEWGDSFSGCSSLEEITLPQNVSAISANLFRDCPALKKIHVDARNAKYCDIDGVLYTKDKSALLICPPGYEGDYVVPNGVTTIGSSAFYNSPSVRTVTIPRSVREIAATAFYYENSQFKGTLNVYKNSYGETYVKNEGITNFNLLNANDGGTIIMQIGNPYMTVNGEYTAIDGLGTAPMIREDRTLLPVRAVVEAMGGTVGWDSPNHCVTLQYNGITILMYIGQNTAYVDGQAYTLDVAPVVINGRTMLPIRFIAEVFHASVLWDNSDGTVTIDYGTAAQH